MIGDNEEKDNEFGFYKTRELSIENYWLSQCSAGNLAVKCYSFQTIQIINYNVFIALNPL
jgi:hypothetical protein